MSRSIEWAIIIIAVFAFTTGLYFLRDTLTQFALALILWLGVDGMTRWLRARAPFVPDWLALPIAMIAILTLLGLVGWGIAQNVGQIAGQTDLYKARIDQMTAALYRLLRIPGPIITVSSIMHEAGAGQLLALIVRTFQDIASNTTFVLLYLIFMFPAGGLIHRKLDRIFPKPTDRAQFAAILTAIRRSMQHYLWVQTLLSAINSTLTYGGLVALGLPNAMFWSFLIFFLNYIPNIGSVIAVILPTLAALVQFPNDYGRIALVAAAVGFWQFTLGSFLQPRMMSNSLNLSAVIVLLSLAVWSAIWGVAGAFLAVPLTVMIMIVLNQFPSTRWLAILMSSDGSPQRIRRAAEEKPLPASLSENSLASQEPEPSLD